MTSSLQSTKIIPNAEIYKVTFKIGPKIYIYIGLDTKCDSDYFGSSLIIYHYQKIYGSEIFNKIILKKVFDISYSALCAVEQKYIRETKESLNGLDEYSINYTGQNKRDNGTTADNQDFANKLIKEALILKLPLRLASKDQLIVKPIRPPFPFGKGTGGMHIETKASLQEIGFAFYKSKGSDTNLGVATAILKDLEFSDDDINTSGDKDDYQFVMASHNSKDPKHLAGLYKRIIELTKLHSGSFVIESSSKNLPINDKEKVEEAFVSIYCGDYKINRYIKGQIRIMRGPHWTKPINNTKEILRMIDAEYRLDLPSNAWSQTRNAGKKVLSKLTKLG